MTEFIHSGTSQGHLWEHNEPSPGTTIAENTPTACGGVFSAATASCRSGVGTRWTRIHNLHREVPLPTNRTVPCRTSRVPGTGRGRGTVGCRCERRQFARQGPPKKGRECEV
ncbi:hypothetical protein MPTK1_6g14450 [Marchantia polymorpha subsp. ruderalis]|uniref:Uncharacterized protein n=2 Tax=Marchantia polymorpha TaxID=3197 RepID=A0AAF6BRZ7_MARPO|nr:hypothetical protein MARPO_0047s0099 [Marchantia polymorpha]PTQ39126.1 hypothetical protein MARPO_0047s0100 [Marchantia polymorpha]BBN14781.1 hypothetical protein Mp_6g14450 [Marchantia polymorpha subsp. ruderalis]BBN14782.1 hypothetical protein Mp_6g14460 [Marchantia polymorpha subsp. ruderalis]|eukprot:PTQ39125.1 hypothetical protein MARPO_0047s0099 [Marchantia polymorpha]